MPRWLVRALFVVMLVVYALAVVQPTWGVVQRAKHGRDYATYHYAVQVTAEGGDPYETAALEERARSEGTRRSVHPYFYPPPYLLTMLWAEPLSLRDGYRAWFWLNQLFVAAIFGIFWRWFRLPLWAAGLLLVTYTPIPDTAKMGQANLFVLLLVVLGLWRQSGLLVSAAAMSKMSPALFLAKWAAQRRWRPVAVAVAGAIGFSVVALPLVSLPHQWRFYTEVLPGFSTGEYHGLTVPISLPANHSVADLFNKLWPGPSAHALAPAARTATMLVNLAALGGLTWFARVRCPPLGEALVAGAFMVLIVVSPVYTYEHHLVMLLLPAAAVTTALARGVLPGWSWTIWVVAYFFLAWPLSWIREVAKWEPALTGWAYETKFMAEVALLGLCLWGAARTVTLPSGTEESEE